MLSCKMIEITFKYIWTLLVSKDNKYSLGEAFDLDISPKYHK